ncbi:MAG: dTDP-glucose 4,6-dehydratase [bacterium]|nr:dTDP-glucose 4,6-dehydratase [bacterium]
MKRKIMVTGGAGFIGSNFIHYIIQNTDYEVVNVDALTYAGNLENLKNLTDEKKHRFIRCDICDKNSLKEIFDGNEFSGVINFAAESHVDRSILDPSVFIDTNVKGTLNLLQLTMERCAGRFLQISTDEVYGELKTEEEKSFTEDSLIKPNSPYAASKASADMLVLAFNRTFKQDVVITRCSNNYGPYQFPEKLIPLIIYKAMRMEKLPIYGDGKNVRDWIHVNDHARGVLLAFEKGKSGEVYNIGSRNEKTNIELVRLILKILGREESLIEFVKDRPGHDRRYSIDPSKAERELGFKVLNDFDSSLRDTVNWYQSNKEWVDHCITGEYREYFKKNYSPKEAI